MFKSPIELLDVNDKKIITKETKEDLQLSVIYEDLLGSSNSNVRNTWLTTFTTNTRFLKDTQKLLSHTLSQFPTPLLSE